MENCENILILGSKDKPKIPNLKFARVYAANYAINKIDQNKDFFKDAKIISVCGVKEIYKHHIFRSIKKSKIDVLILRTGFLKDDEFVQENRELIQLNKNQQFLFQAQFFKKGIIDIIRGELKYETGLLKKVDHIKKCLKSGFLGVSTGFFCVLKELSESRNSKIYIAGIGLGIDDEFQNPYRSYYRRARVDINLINSLKEIYVNRIMSTDENLSRHSNFKLYKENLSTF